MGEHFGGRRCTERSLVGEWRVLFSFRVCMCTTKSSQGHILKFLQYSVHYDGTPELSQNKEVFQTIDQFPIFETHPYASTISWYGEVNLFVWKYVGGASRVCKTRKIAPTCELESWVARCNASWT